jgi:hypothetical protein
MERKLFAMDWSRCVNLSVLVICVVHTWQVYIKMSYVDTTTEERKPQNEFYGHLAAELIDNKYDHIGGRQQQSSPDGSLVDHRTGKPRSGVYAHLTSNPYKAETK